MAEQKKLLIIEGIRENGTKFRPSDWPERLSSSYGGFGKDHRLHYSSGIRPCVCNGQKALAVEASLQEQNPTLFQHVMQFARDNHLRTHETAEVCEQ